MKYAIEPKPWEETIAVLDAAGFERAALSDASFLIYTGDGTDFPDPLPENIGFVQIPSAGVDHVLDAMKGSSVPWSNAAGVYDNTVAESTIALLLAQLHAHRRVNGTFDSYSDMEAHTSYLYDDKTVAIIGAGGIGKRLITMLSGFGPRIIAVNRSGNPVEGADETYPIAEVDKVWPNVDYVVLIAPLTPDTHHMVDAEAFKQMPDHAVVVNVGRGPLINTEDLVAALEAGEIAGAALDVTDPEPLPEEHPLWQDQRVVITPHIANTQRSVREKIGAHTIKVATAFAAGKQLPTLVDPHAGY
ncbi:D-isomer specific 2-hydroxyacid dehydrogenase family protein [Corynebacterium singulare]|uniref:D-isomer specific 2-hydroxyacid dehydrogenase family protein n=1 Tax=Corynebacterium singulare TaxID=161899 RepID=A0ABS9PUD5_9CORY|nr:D-isomer specific 2-hydroxyacid dehydrogenase family protein [Corynebacterium singulare]MCG7275651.1 D-isomer specific 2-hydroxyacid dehydrogenase family protein [Corynebacterium singulare]